jgi:hypothetical protein
MQLSELRTLVGELQQLDLDNQAGASPSSSNLNAQLNRALRWIAEQTHLCYNDKVSITLTAAERRYSIQSTTPKLLAVDRVVINGRPLRGPDGEYGLYTLADVQLWHPLYLSYDDGAPMGAFMQDDYHLVFFPAPTQAIQDDGSNYLSGPYIPATLSQDTDEPDIPVQYHEHIAYVAAIFSSEPLASEQEAWIRLEKYNARVYLDLKKLQAKSKARRMASNGVRGKRADWSGGDVISPQAGGYRTR